MNITSVAFILKVKSSTFNSVNLGLCYNYYCHVTTVAYTNKNIFLYELNYLKNFWNEGSYLKFQY